MERIKWSFDSVVLAAVAADLEPLIGGTVTRVLQPDRDEIVLAIGARRRPSHVLLSIHPRWARAHLIGDVDAGAAASFCQLLRARLEGARLGRIVQPAFERTLTLTFTALDDEVDLVVEIMGRHSNLIAVGGGTILGSLKSVTAAMSSVRQILPGIVYVSPPRGLPAPQDLTEPLLRERLAGATGSPARRLAGTILGISPLMATELAVRAGLNPAGRTDDPEQLAAVVWPVLVELVDTVVHQRFEPVVYHEDGAPVACTPFPYVHLAGWSVEPTPTMSAAVAAVAGHAASRSHVDEERSALLAAIGAAMAKIARTQAELEKSQTEAAGGESLKQRANLLFAYASQIPSGSTEATLPGFDGTPVTIQLDPTVTAVDNARRLFKRYARIKSAQPQVAQRLREVAAQREYLDSMQVLTETATSADDLEGIREELVKEGMLKSRRRQRRPATPRAGPRYYTTASGADVVVGRTNLENDRVTFAIGRPDDLWLHARGMPGAHVILRTGGRTAPEEAIRSAAQIAAYFSRGRGAGTVPVSYTLRKYVKKPRGARPGLVTITNEKTVVVEPRLPQTTQAGKQASEQA
ncbi:MAG TPA: NFACT family protein [bacterium]|jgi:predicted ribosome quality control (RQC) complex YloA/Tae2 family protein|nr:NFACT family protein [bacterium]